MQPSGGGGGGGGTPFDTRPTFPGQTPQKEDERRSDEGQGPGTVFEFVQGFTPIPNPVARTILSDTSLSPEQQQLHANLMGLRNGGSVGFRPLGYASGGTADADLQRQAEHQNALAMIKFYLGQGSDRIPDQERVGTGTLRALLDAYAKDPEAAIGYWNKLSKLITPGNDMGDLGAISTAPTGQVVAPSANRGVIEGMSAIPDMAAEEYDRRIPPPENLTALGRFMHDKFGFDNPPDVSGEQHWSNYAHGGSVPHGTVAGELPRYGNMSVREEGESMGEMAKRHKEQDWYNRMRQSPTLGKVRIA